MSQKATLGNAPRLVVTEEETFGTEVTFGDERERLDTHSSTLVGHLAYILCGYDRSGMYWNRMFLLDTTLMRWANIAASGILMGAEVEVVLAEDELYIFGGISPSYESDLKTWKFDVLLCEFTPCYSRNPPRFLSSKAAGEYVEELRSIVTFAGTTLSGSVGQVFAYSVDANEWKPVNTKGKRPLARSGHCSCLHGTSDIFFFGGIDEEFRYVENSLCHLRCHGGVFIWAEVDWVRLSLAARYCTMVCAGHRLFIYGGERADAPQTNYFAVLDVSKRAGAEIRGDYTIQQQPNELPVKMRGVPRATTRHSLEVINNKIIALGGESGPLTRLTVFRPA